MQGAYFLRASKIASQSVSKDGIALSRKSRSASARNSRSDNGFSTNDFARLMASLLSVLLWETFCSFEPHAAVV
jgi:hypothetical protein